MKLVIEVDTIRGFCPVYHKGDRIVLDDGYRINPELSANICMHSLASILPYYNALAKGVDPAVLGLAGKDGCAYVHCLDPQEKTGGGTVTLRISRLDEDRAL